MSVAYQPHSHCLMHHGVQQDNVVGLKGDYGLEPRLLEKLLCNEPDAVAGTLQYKGSVPQVCQMDGLLLCQWVGGRQGHQQFFVGNGDVGDLAAGGTGAQCQVHQSPGDGSRLLGGIQLGEAQGDVRVPAGELVVDPAEDDGTPVGGGGKTDRLAVAAGDLFHGQQHTVLLVKDLLGAFYHIPSHGGWVQAAVVPQEQSKAKGALALCQKLAQRRGGDVERLRRMAQIAIICNGGKVIILTGGHSSSLLLQNGKKSDFSQKSAKCWGIWKSFSIISIKDHKRNCKLL